MLRAAFAVVAHPCFVVDVVDVVYSRAVGSTYLIIRLILTEPPPRARKDIGWGKYPLRYLRLRSAHRQSAVISGLQAKTETEIALVKTRNGTLLWSARDFHLRTVSLQPTAFWLLTVFWRDENAFSSIEGLLRRSLIGESNKT